MVVVAVKIARFHRLQRRPRCTESFWDSIEYLLHRQTTFHLTLHVTCCSTLRQPSELCSNEIKPVVPPCRRQR